MVLFHLDWLVHRDGERGYRVRTKPGRKGRVDATLLESIDVPASAMIVRKEGELIASEPLKNSGLWRELADCSRPEDVLRFIGRHGFLTSANAKEEDATHVIEAAKDMRRLRDVAKRLDWRKVEKHLDAIGGIGRLGIVFHYREGMARPELRLRPPSLLHAIQAQAVMDVTQGVNHNKCVNPNCPVWFPYGPGAPHRETAKYCSARCKNAHKYLKRKESSK